MADAILTISSKNYSSWSLRGWLITKFSGISFQERFIPASRAAMRAELLLLSPSMLVPTLHHDGLAIWNNLAIGEYLNEVKPEAELLPVDRLRRARCRSISGEINSGFAPLRSALPMNIKASFENFRVWSRAQADLDRIFVIWRECLAEFGGPFLLGSRRTMADAMFAPVVTRLETYHVPTDAVCASYCRTILDMPEMAEWIAAAKAEQDGIDELEIEA